MGKLLTQDEFIARAVDIHGDRYDYCETVYVRGKDKVKIGCRKHGPFWQHAGNHLQGQGCSKCGDESAGSKKSSNTEEFLRKSTEFHGPIFDYSHVNYINNTTLVEIRCLEHNLTFHQLAATHLKYNGCPECKADKLRLSSTKTTEEFIVSARKKHGDRYDYSLVNYTSYWDKVAIKCNDHGVFWQVAGWHTSQGNGCPSCAQGGYSFNKPGTLYVLIDGSVTKIGITNYSAKARLGYINPRAPYTFEVFKEYSELDGRLCEETEAHMLKFLRSKYESPTDKYPGYTESFFAVDRAELLSMLDGMLVKA